MPVKKVEERYGQCQKLTTSTGLDPYNESFDVPEMDKEAECWLPSKKNPIGKWAVDAATVLLVCGKLRSGELLDHSLVLVSRSNPQDYGPNQSLKRLVNRELHPSLFRGPLLMVGMNKVKLPRNTIDLDTTSFTLGLDAAAGVAPPGKIAFHAQKVMAVKVNKHTSPPTFEPLEISKRHPAFKSGTISKIAESNGPTPLQTWSYPASAAKDASIKPSDDTATLVPFDINVLHLCIDPASPDFGRVPTSIREDKRSMLVVRPTNNLGIGLDTTYFTKLGKNFEDKFVPLLSDEQYGTPGERLRAMHAMSSEVWKVVQEAMEVRKKLVALGLSDKEADMAARASIGLAPV